MNKLDQQWVSAAVDGEVDAQVLAELAADTESHQQWGNYHLIGDAMRGELPKMIDMNFSAKIATMIENEPAIMVPHALPPHLEQRTSKTVFGSMFKQFGQYAIAASVALLVIVGVRDYQQTSSNNVSPLPVLNTRPLVGSASPVSLQTNEIPQRSQQADNDRRIEQRINVYIKDHMLQQKLNSRVNVNRANSNDSDNLAPSKAKH